MCKHSGQCNTRIRPRTGDIPGTAAELRPVHSSNKVVKFAEDAYVIVPAENSEKRATELLHVSDWAERNN